jgi:hypothetical protein
MSALGQKRTWQRILLMSALPPIADIQPPGSEPAGWHASTPVAIQRCLFDLFATGGHGDGTLFIHRDLAC